MNRNIKILSLNTLVVALGVLIAFAVIAEPIFKQKLSHVISIADSTQQKDSKDDQKPETIISEFQAVTPAVQFDLSSQKFILKEVNIEFQKVETRILASIQQTSNKLFSILFRLIIGPNAP